MDKAEVIAILEKLKPTTNDDFQELLGCTINDFGSQPDIEARAVETDADIDRVIAWIRDLKL